MLASGFPLVALLQLVRVYGQAMAGIADAEVRLFHLYVHEPLLRSGSSGVETAEQMHAISREVLPLAGPVLDQIHQRYLQHFIEQDVVGHMEADFDGVDLGRMRVAIAFADLAGYTRLTEEEGELTASTRSSGSWRRSRSPARRGPGDQDDRRRGDDRQLRPGGADRLGGGFQRLQTDAAAPDRHPLRGRAVPRRRLLRPGGQHRLARRGAVGGGGGPRHPSGGRVHRAPAPHLEFDASARSSSRDSPSRPRSSSPANGRRLIDEAVRDAGLLAGAPVVVMFSGGRDSTCLLDLAVRIAGADAVSAVHANYGLRGAADADERHCAEVCEALGVQLESAGRVRRGRGGPRSGNLQAWARAEHYRAAAEMAMARGADVAAGHTPLRSGGDDPLPDRLLARAGARCSACGPRRRAR